MAIELGGRRLTGVFLAPTKVGVKAVTVPLELGVHCVLDFVGLVEEL